MQSKPPPRHHEHHVIHQYLHGPHVAQHWASHHAGAVWLPCSVCQARSSAPPSTSSPPLLASASACSTPWARACCHPVGCTPFEVRAHAIKHAGVQPPPPGILAALIVHTQQVDPSTAAAQFAQRFAASNGNEGPQWLHCSWADATSRAHAAYKFLFVYLHCPSHQDTARFCRETLCNSELVSYIDQTFLSWGGNVHSADAYQVGA